MADASILYPSITNFIISHIQSSTTTSSTQSQSVGVAARPLIRLIEKEFFDDGSDIQASQSDLGSLSQVDISAGGTRKVVVDLLKRLTVERVLKATTLEFGGSGFKMHPGWQEKQWDEGLSRGRERYYTDSDKTEEEIEVQGGDEGEGESDVLGGEEGHRDQSLEPDNFDGAGDEARLWREESDAERHAQAYNEMTRGAAPLPTPDLENNENEDPESQNIQTPNRKRRRIMEIAASDLSSPLASLSPNRYSNSTPRSPTRRIRTPQSGSRRRSAPGNMSPSKDKSPLFKEETRRDNSPAWLKTKIQEMQAKYPDDVFQTEDGVIRCLDCDRTFNPPKNNLGSFEQHLKGKPHRVSVEQRLVKAGQTEMFYPNLGIGSSSSMNLGIPHQQPLTVFAQHGQSSKQESREGLNRYFDYLENEDSKTSIRVSLLEGRFNTREKLDNARFEQQDQAMSDFETRAEERIEGLEDQVTTEQEVGRQQMKDLRDKLNFSDASRKEQVREMKDIINENRQTVDETKIEANRKLDDMLGMLARSDHRNEDKLDQMKEDLAKTKNEFKEERTTIKEGVDKLDRTVTNHQQLIDRIEAAAERLAHSETQAQDHMERQSERVAHLEQSLGHLEDSKELEQRLSRRLADMNERITGSEVKSEEEVGQMSQKINVLEESFTSQQSYNMRVDHLEERFVNCEVKLEEESKEVKAESKRLQRTIQNHENLIYELEATNQLQTNVRQQDQIEREDALRKILEKHISAHILQTETKFRSLETSHAEEMQDLKQQLYESRVENQTFKQQIEKLKKREAVHAKAIKKLEKSAGIRKEEIEETREFLFAHIQDTAGLRTFVQNLEHEVKEAILEDASPDTSVNSSACSSPRKVEHC